jgi:biotin transport system substrate-specific component
MTTTLPLPRRGTALVDHVVPRTALGDVILVGAGAALTAFAAQIVVPLSPVPFTLQTFSVLLVGASLGSLRGALSMLVYLVAGTLGVPVFAAASAGADAVLGATGGYLVGFVLAAWLVGRIVERTGTSPLRTAAGLLAGSAVVYAVGVPWLAVSLGISLDAAAAAGLSPFLAGDAIKLAAAAILLPTAAAVGARVARRDER